MEILHGQDVFEPPGPLHEQNKYAQDMRAWVPNNPRGRTSRRRTVPSTERCTTNGGYPLEFQRFFNIWGGLTDGTITL